jgi:hypothetical protein
MPELISNTAVKAVQAVQGYKDGAECCARCTMFGKDERLGEGPPPRCEANRAFWFPVDPAGRCDLFVLAA